MKKLLTYTAVLSSLLLPSTQLLAADPVWQEGKTAQSYPITVYRSKSCGCCKAWLEHLENHNFDVKDVVVQDVSQYKKQYQVPQRAASCHTAVVNDKVIEGHVPAQDIKTLLASKNDIRLLTVPGMPSGGPGMDFEGARKDQFTVYAVDKNNQVSTYNEYSDY